MSLIKVILFVSLLNLLFSINFPSLKLHRKDKLSLSFSYPKLLIGLNLYTKYIKMLYTYITPLQHFHKKKKKRIRKKKKKYIKTVNHKSFYDTLN